MLPEMVDPDIEIDQSRAVFNPDVFQGYPGLNDRRACDDSGKGSRLAHGTSMWTTTWLPLSRFRDGKEADWTTDELLRRLHPSQPKGLRISRRV